MINYMQQAVAKSAKMDEGMDGRMGWKEWNAQKKAEKCEMMMMSDEERKWRRRW